MAVGSRLVGVRTVVARLEQSLAVAFQDLVSEFGRAPLRTALRLGEAERVLPGIYAATGRAGDFLVRARALSLWAQPAGSITGLAAAHLWKILDEPPARITLQVPPAWHPKRQPHWARTLRVPPSGRRFRLEGISLVPAADAVVQSWREARPDIGVATVIASIMRDRATASDLLDALSRRVQMPRRGQLAELIGLVGNTVTSYLEYVAWREVFPPLLFPHLQWQVEIWPTARKRVMDAFDPDALIDLEFDGGSTHGGVDGFERDRERDADMRVAGIEPLHFTYRDLTQRAEWCREQYRALRSTRMVPDGRE